MFVNADACAKAGAPASIRADGTLLRGAIQVQAGQTEKGYADLIAVRLANRADDERTRLLRDASFEREYLPRAVGRIVDPVEQRTGS